MWKFLFNLYKNVTFLLKETLAKLWSHFFHAIHASRQSKASVYIVYMAKRRNITFLYQERNTMLLRQHEATAVLAWPDRNSFKKSPYHA